jgi:hypothetical protein
MASGLTGLGKKAVTPDEDVTVIRNYIEQFRGLQILNGQLQSVTFGTGATSATLTHSLGRSYLGAIVVGTALVQPFAATPQSTATAGLDPTKQVLVLLASAPAVPNLVNVWVF